MIAVADFHDLTDGDLAEIVREAIRTGTAIDRMASRRIFGGKPPKMWKDWPRGAVALYDAAVRTYESMTRPTHSHSPIRSREQRTLTVRHTWVVIESVGAAAREECGGDEWWELPNVTWAEIAAVVGMSAPALVYRFDRLGWKLEGVWRSRRIVAAPCVVCGDPWPAPKIIENRGPCCHR